MNQKLYTRKQEKAKKKINGLLNISNNINKHRKIVKNKLKIIENLNKKYIIKEDEIIQLVGENKYNELKKIFLSLKEDTKTLPKLDKELWRDY